MDGRDTAPSRPPNPALPYREDCWSEGETSALVEAWGDRYLELNRGNLRQKHWQEVADAVNSRRGASASRRPPRTDVQCKNRIDTLKKKYKIEKARIVASDGAAASQWAFYDRLDALIGSSAPAKKPSPPLALPLSYHRKGSPLPAATARPSEKRPVAAIAVDNSSFFRRAAAAAAAEAVEDDEEDDSGSSARSGRGSRGAREGEGDGIQQLARAIMRFAEIYERVEEAKQRQIMELEKQRMEFARGLEIQRMQIFVDSQVQLEKIKRVKRADVVSSVEGVTLLHGGRPWKDV